VNGSIEILNLDRTKLVRRLRVLGMIGLLNISGRIIVQDRCSNVFGVNGDIGVSEKAVVDSETRPRV
jgi:hypothetical protein